MKPRHTRKPPSAEEPRRVPEKDPRDEPGPTIYGEELEGQCSPDFIVSPPPKCSTQKIEVPAFRGDFCWILFPGSEWETQSPAAKLIEAQAFFQKYCLYFNFSEKTLPADRANEYEQWYADWKAAVRQSVIPDRHVPALRRRLVATNPGASSERIDELVADEIRQILRNATIPSGLHGDFFRKMQELQQEAAGSGCRNVLIVFIDEYVCYNPKPTRASACQLNFNQIGITAVDSASRNVLAHEMVHLLGKPAPNRGGKVTWEHEKCANSILRVTRSDWWRPFQFADLLSSAAYQEIIRNQNGLPAASRLIERVN